MQDNSSISNTATGICPSCKQTVIFEKNENITRCPNCFNRPTRYLAGAVDSDHQRFGYKPGGGRC